MANQPPRPNYLEFRSPSYRSDNSATSSELPSPRTGEIPPALSPLDAFAFQGRLLARRFEEANKDGKRLSRLPALTVQNEFMRPSYFNTTTADTREGAPNAEDEEPVPFSPGRMQAQENRPRSHYPTFGSDDDDFEHDPMPQKQPLGQIAEADTPPPQQDYFSIPRAASPESIEHKPAASLQPETKLGVVQLPTPVSPANIRSQQDQLPMQPPQRQDSSAADPTPKQSALIPPRSSSRSKVSPAVRSVPDSVEDDFDRMSLGGSVDSLPPPQLSTGSTWSRSHSPASPFQHAFPRSPSVASDYSVGGTKLPKPSFNFSRPMSRGGGRPSVDSGAISIRSQMDNQSLMDARPSIDTRPSFEVPVRQDSYESSMPSIGGPSRSPSGDCPNPGYGSDMIQTPISVLSDDSSFFPGSRPLSFASNKPAPSYIYSRYQLPRGRKLDRNSVLIDDDGNLIDPYGTTPPNQIMTPPNLTPDRPSTAPKQPAVGNSPNAPRSRSLDQRRGGSPSLNSETSTLKARSQHTTTSKRTSAEVSPEAHLDKGIDLHEKGRLQESTYHLRLAARGGHPTAMLLYALACRHGWGMRPSQAEGVQWLRKAVDTTQIDAAEAEDEGNKGSMAAKMEGRAHKAQFALAVYELGVSYLNGWGIQQDRPLALRCFEIAGSWGDADALAEAGFCYTEGMGCKKDLKKAAKFYREAEAKGMSMAGNSWCVV